MKKEEVKKEILERVKETFTINDDMQNTYINKLTSNAFDEFSVLTGSDEVKEKYLFVIEGVVNKRYVRRGSEGLTSENTDGYSVNYKDSANDFDEYKKLLSVEYNIKSGAKRKRIRTVRFL